MNLLAAKIYNDGSNWIAIPHTEKPYKPRRQRKKREKSEEIQQLEKSFTKSKGKRTNRKAKLLQEFTPMFKDKDEAEQFVEEHFERLSRNRWERYKRMMRRGYTNRWNYFCTYTYDSEKPNAVGIWTAVTIREMLNKIIYIGHMPQLRWTSYSYKNHKRFRKDEKEWTVVYNTHEPIIAQELWDRVQERQKSVATGRQTKIGFARIRDIHSSEKVMYRQVLDLYATSIDYDPNSAESIA